MHTINFRKYPFRGIWTEAGQMLKMRPQHVIRSYHRQNPKVVSIVDTLIVQRSQLKGVRYAT